MYAMSETRKVLPQKCYHIKTAHLMALGHWCLLLCINNWLCKNHAALLKLPVANTLIAAPATTCTLCSQTATVNQATCRDLAQAEVLARCCARNHCRKRFQVAVLEAQLGMDPELSRKGCSPVSAGSVELLSAHKSDTSVGDTTSSTKCTCSVSRYSDVHYQLPIALRTGYPVQELYCNGMCIGCCRSKARIANLAFLQVTAPATS